MALPVIPLPKSSVDIGGVPVPFRSLTRKEALHVTTGFRDDPDAAEVYILSLGAGITEAEAIAWRESTDPTEAGKLVDAIIYLTGLAKPPAEGSKDPKA
jgi:hypothetical protein